MPLWLLSGNPWAWFHRLGDPGLILLGILDNSVIPLPGSVDVMVILLSSNHRAWWPYYALMATAGAVIGGFLSYRLAEKGEKATVEKKIGRGRAEKVYRRFEKRGFATVAISAIMPPPFPMVPVLLAAGALHYPPKKFLGALATGRAIRFFLVAYLAHVYGNGIIGWLSRYYKPLARNRGARRNQRALLLQMVSPETTARAMSSRTTGGTISCLLAKPNATRSRARAEIFCRFRLSRCDSITNCIF
jgi:membrane protein YqaA with SNARE-associated domain